MTRAPVSVEPDCPSGCGGTLLALPDAPAPAYPSHLEHLARLKRAEGQIRGVVKMIEDGKYCVDILGQLKAARAAIAAVEAKVLAKHVRCCLQDAFMSGDESAIDEKIDEIVALTLKNGR